MIYETVVTTLSPSGEAHLAPMGVRYEGDQVLMMPFRPSRTLDNVLTSGRAVLNLTTDVRVFAGCVTGRKDWPTVPLDGFAGHRLRDTLAHVELELLHPQEDDVRPVLYMRRLREESHGSFRGLNRAQAAIVEGAVLVSRLGMLPREKIEQEMTYLQIAIDKTAGETELQAWAWLSEAVDAHFAGIGTNAGGGR